MYYSPAEAAELSHTFAFVKIEHTGVVLNITLNRPEKKNAMNHTVLRELAFALAYAEYNPGVWVVVVRAVGDVFCAGADLKMFAGHPDEPNTSTVPIPAGQPEILVGELFNKLHKPSIAVVHAPVMAGGFLIICGCLYVVASVEATFALTEVKRGIWPMQVMASLSRVLTPRQTLDLCILGKTIDAQTAFELGLVTHLAPPETLETKTQTLVQQITENSPTAIRMGLEAFDQLRTIPDHQQHAFLKQRLNQLLQTQDAQEGIAAFTQKRKPVWTGK